MMSEEPVKPCVNFLNLDRSSDNTASSAYEAPYVQKNTFGGVGGGLISSNTPTYRERKREGRGGKDIAE